jgi:hypothetical protein
MAKQQGNATAGFQVADAAAERRQREVLPGGGTGQTSFLHRGDKHTRLILGFGVLDLVSGDQCAD